MHFPYRTSLILSSALLLALTACGGNSEPVETEPATAPVFTEMNLDFLETAETTTQTRPAQTDTTDETTAPASEHRDGLPDNPTWRDFYALKLRDFAATSGYIPASMNADSHTQYGIADLDGNGLPELLISFNRAEDTACTIYYLADGGEVLVAGQFGEGGRFRYDANHRYLYTLKQEPNQNSYVAFAYANHSLEQKLTMMDDLGEQLIAPTVETEPPAEGEEPAPYGENATYLINDNPVTRDEYLAYFQDYANSTFTELGGLHDFDVNTTADQIVY